MADELHGLCVVGIYKGLVSDRDDGSYPKFCVGRMKDGVEVYTYKLDFSRVNASSGEVSQIAQDAEKLMAGQVVRVGVFAGAKVKKADGQPFPTFAAMWAKGL